MSKTKRTNQISNNSNNNNILVKLLNYINGRNRKRETKNEIEKRQANASVMVARWTMILSIFTIILAGIGFGTAYILYGQFEVSQEQFFETQKDARIDQRAWLSISGIKTTFNGKKPDTFIVTVKNTGKTPALKTANFINLFNARYEVDCLFSSIPDPTKLKDYGMIGPGDELHIIFHEISPTLIKDFYKSGDLYVCGIICYVDVFGQKHWTQFCRNPTSNFKDFTIRTEYNRTDDEQSK